MVPSELNDPDQKRDKENGVVRQTKVRRFSQTRYIAASREEKSHPGDKAFFSA
ncbi:MAG: hypothetical protein K2H64_06835 [Desulfovibrio sp.]|nr:hypothetical protein [Desulfovibrio sp.]